MKKRFDLGELGFNIFFSSGVQRRTIKCYWGGHKCLGYKNEEENQPFCSYRVGFLDSFCDTNWILPNVSVLGVESLLVTISCMAFCRV